MADAIIAYFSQTNDVLATFLMSLLPIIELRGSIIFAAAQNVPWYIAYIVSVIGNVLPIPFIILFLRPILNYLKKTKHLAKAANWLQERSMKKADKILKYEILGLFLFVAIPLPGTGAWTGAVIASLLDMRIIKAFPTIVLGVMAAGIIMVLGSYGFFSVITHLF